MSTIFFDLDGTLIDSELGIFNSTARALREMGRDVPSDDVLQTWIGPPMRDSFATVLETPELVEQATELYRLHYDREGWREHTVYAGIEDAVRALHAAGHALYVVTAKNEPHARRIVAHLPFGECFIDVFGATVDGRLSHKNDLIAAALQRWSLRAEDCAMVGDRRMDMQGAREHGLRAVGVLWGFGDEAELGDAGAQDLVERPQALVPLFVH